MRVCANSVQIVSSYYACSLCAESEQIGASTIEVMGRQREQLEKSSGFIQQSLENTEQARLILKEMWVKSSFPIYYLYLLAGLSWLFSILISCQRALWIRAYRALKNKIFLYCVIALLLIANGAVLLHLWRRKHWNPNVPALRMNEIHTATCAITKQYLHCLV